MNIKYINGVRIKLTLSHRWQNWTQDLYFSNYKEARLYAEDLYKVRSILNGFTIRRMVLLDDGNEVCERVLMHRRWVPLNECITGQPISRNDDAFDSAAAATVGVSANPYYMGRGR